MPSIEDWLNDLGLGKYSKTFAANDVDFRVLPDLNSADLQELGVSLGHRKIMLAVIAALLMAVVVVAALSADTIWLPAASIAAIVVALPLDVTGPVRFASVVTFPAVRPAAVPVRPVPAPVKEVEESTPVPALKLNAVATFAACPALVELLVTNAG